MHKERLVRELNIEPIVEELQEKHLISPNDIKEIRRKLTQSEKVEEFIHFLQHASDTTYGTFLDVLRHTNQKDLLELLGKLSIMCVYIICFFMIVIKPLILCKYQNIIVFLIAVKFFFQYTECLQQRNQKKQGDHKAENPLLCNRSR